MSSRLALAPTVAVLLWCSSSSAEPERLSAAEILGEPPKLALELVRTRVTAYEQHGHGYQSQAGTKRGPGSETLHVLQTQAELRARQGDNIEHQLWVPVDIVTSASANASDRYYAEPDIISTASAKTFAAEVRYEVTAHADNVTALSAGAGYHLEETMNSWQAFAGYRRSLADDNASLRVGMGHIQDWFPEYELGGNRAGRGARASSFASVGASQLLSETTAVDGAYSLTLQAGQLANTHSSVPSSDGERVAEALPSERQRHAASIRLVQWLPWQAALRVGYRLYGDSWRALAHTADATLRQRLFSYLSLGLTYRYHRQRAVRYFNTLVSPQRTFRTADSDLARLTAQTLGVSATLSLPTRRFGELFLQAGYDHYFRSNDLRVNVATWASGFRF